MTDGRYALAHAIFPVLGQKRRQIQGINGID